MSAALETGRSAKAVRRRAAILPPVPTKGAPPATIHEIAPVTERRLRTMKGAIPMTLSSAAANLEIETPSQAFRGRPAKIMTKFSVVPPVARSTPDEGRGDSQIVPESQRHCAVSATVSELVQLQRIRRFCITSQSRCDRSIESMIASTLGFRIDADEKDRKKVFAQAKAFRLSAEGGEGHHDHATQGGAALAAIVPLVIMSAATRKVWDSKREATEKQMETLAKQLPVWQFVQSVRGLAALGLAAIVAEAGIPLGDYRTVSGLWKRMGLAVINGERQRKKSNVDEAAAHGYSPKRRAEIWAFCSDTMFRAQWRGDKDEDGIDPKKTGKPVATPAHAIGAYGVIYARRRAITAERVALTESLPATDPMKWSKGRAHNDARRIMTKALLVDLYLTWRGNDRTPGRFLTEAI